MAVLSSQQLLKKLQEADRQSRENSYSRIHTSFQKSADRKFWVGQINQLPGDFDDGIYFENVMFTPAILANKFDYSGNNAIYAGAGGVGAGVAQMALCFTESYINKQIAEEELKKKMRRLQLHARKIAELEEELKLSEKSNEELFDLLQKLRKKKRAENLARYRLDKIDAWLAKFTKRDEEESTGHKVMSVVDWVAKVLMRCDTGVGMMLYGVYYFGSVFDPAAMLRALIFGPIIGLIRWTASFVAEKGFKPVTDIEGEEMDLASVDDYLKDFQHRHACLKQIKKLKKASILKKQKKDEKISGAVYKKECTRAFDKIDAFYQQEQRSFNRYKWLERIDKTQSMIYMGACFGIVPIKLIFWFSGIAIGGTAFFIAMPICGLIMSALFLYKNYREIKKTEAQILDKMQDVKEYELDRAERWTMKYGCNVEHIIDVQYHDSEQKLIRQLLTRALELDDQDELYKVLATINDYTDVQVNPDDSNFYDHLAHYLSERRTKDVKAIVLATALKNKMMTSEEKLKPININNKPPVNTAALKEVAKFIGHVVSVAAPIFSAVYLASVICSGPMAPFMAIGLAVIAGISILCMAIGKYAQVRREQTLQKLDQRERKAHIIDRCVKVEHKLQSNGVAKNNETDVVNKMEGNDSSRPCKSYRFAQPAQLGKELSQRKVEYRGVFNKPVVVKEKLSLAM